MAYKYGHKATSLSGVYTYLQRYYTHIPEISNINEGNWNRENIKFVGYVMVGFLKSKKMKFRGKDRKTLPMEILAMNVQKDWDGFKDYLFKNYAIGKYKVVTNEN